jgi:subtilisin family serine protease
MAFCLHCPVYGVVATGPDGSNAQAVHALGYTGAGVNVGIITVSNARVTHEAFYDKDANGLPTGSSHAFWHDATTSGSGTYYTGTNGHDTWVAGVIASRGGAANPGDIGVAPGVNLYSERVVVTIDNTINSQYIENAMDDLVSHNCHVVFTGFQFGDGDPAPDGTSIWTLIYDYYADTHNIVFANPAGNYDNLSPNPNITVFGDAYNGITTGGLDVTEPDIWRTVGSLSCFGMTADGRRKPDLVAPSQNQTMPNYSSDTSWITWTTEGGHTSLSTPHTAGVAALLLSYANSTAQADEGQNEVIRAVIVNSTFPNIKDNNNVPTTGQLYNVARGYGRIDALRAYQTLAAARITPNSHTSAMRGWSYDNVKNATDTYYVLGTKNQRLLVTLAWNRRITRLGPGNYTPQALTNLNLQILDPNGISVFQEANAKDNLRKCDLLLSKTGEYRIRVTNSSNTSTDYGLAFEIVPSIPGDFDMNYIVDYNDMATLASQWLLDGAGLAADLAAPTGHVDFADFAVFAQNWLLANNAYYVGY